MLTYTTTLLFACQAFFPRLQKFTAFFAPLFSKTSAPTYSRRKIPPYFSRFFPSYLRQNFVFFPCIRTHDILSPSHTLGLTALRIAFSPRKFTCPVRQYPYTRIMSAAASVFFLCFALFRVSAAVFPSAKKTARFPTDGRSFLKSPVLPFIELEHSRYCSYHNVYIGIRGIRAHIVIELIPPLESRIKLIILSPRFIYCLYLLH